MAKKNRWLLETTISSTVENGRYLNYNLHIFSPFLPWSMMRESIKFVTSCKNGRSVNYYRRFFGMGTIDAWTLSIDTSRSQATLSELLAKFSGLYFVKLLPKFSKFFKRILFVRRLFENSE